MICSKCGTQNLEGSKFCVKCGNNLIESFSQNDSQMMNQQFNNNVADVQFQQVNNNSFNNVAQQSLNNFSGSTSLNNESLSSTQVANNYNQSAVQQQVVSDNYNNQPQYNASNYVTSNANTSNERISFGSYFFIILAVILKPFTSFKEELNKFKIFKNSLFVSLIVSLFATIVTLLKTMYSAVRVTSYSWSSGTTKSWVWQNLKEINYIKVIGTNILIYLGIIFAIAIIYYLASLIIKKQTNFSKFLGISALSVIPFVICYLVISPLLSMMYAPLGMIVTIIGMVYTIVLVYETMNAEILVEGNAKYYFNLICLSILSIASYYLFMKVFSSSVSNGINDILGKFGF